MSVVTLVSGGLDSTLVAFLTREEGVEQFPLFVDYGQRARGRELEACRCSMLTLGLREPWIADMAGFGRLIRSGLTDPGLRLVEDAFTPGRNLLFLLLGASLACQVGANAVSIGLLHEDTSLFPDQTAAFIAEAGRMLSRSMGCPIRVLAPLSTFHKRDVVELARLKGLAGTYSCHAGTKEPCGTCIACREFDFGEA